MEARERVQRVLRGEAVDRPPICLWHHFRPEGSAERLAAATVDFFGRLGLDLFKVMPDIPYPSPPGGSLADPAAWWQVPRLGAGAGEPLSGIPETVRLVRAARPEAVILATVFSPLALALRFANGAEALLAAAAAQPRAVAHGMSVLAANVADQCVACLAAGADGIYFATAGLGDDRFSAEAYQVWGRPYDLQALQGAAGGWCNVLHLHADRNLHWQWARDYPAAVISWSDRHTGVRLAEVAEALPDRAVMGGINETGAIVRGDMDAVAAEMADAVRQTGGRRLILAGGCSVPDQIAEANLSAARALVERLV